MRRVLAVGSSIFEAYREMQSMIPGCILRNGAVGGTTSEYWATHLTEVLGSDSPDAVLLYCGSNDLNEGILEGDIVANVMRCHATVHRLLPNAAFGYFSIIKAPQKRGKWDLIDGINAAIRGRLSPSDLYVETNEVFFPDGYPAARFFVEDGLHLSDDAYVALSTYARPLVSAWLETELRPTRRVDGMR
jgi:lysophospholipase L1-like esterase